MKATKRIVATIMSLCLILGCIFTTALAEEQAGGSITIQNQSGTNATVAGKTFNLFKIFSASTSTDGENISYDWCEDINGKTFEGFFKQGTYNYLEADGSTINDVVEGIAILGNSAFDLSQFAAAIHSYVHDADIQPVDTINADNSATSVTFSGLGLGYYMVYDATDFSGEEATAAVRSAAMLTTNQQNVTISLKANRPAVKKEVLENNGNFGKGTSSNIGDIATFKISTHIPSHTLYGEYQYYIEDSMPEGFELQKDTIKVYRKIEGQSQDEELTVANGFYELTFPTENNVDFKINFTESLDKYSANDEIYVTYNAIITNQIKAQKANVNTVKLTYSNDPTNVDSLGSSTDTASVFSYQFVFTKFAQNASGNFLNKRLKGAEFQLFRMNGDEPEDTPIAFTKKTIDATADLNAYTQYIVAKEETDETVDTLVAHDSGEETISISGNNYGGHLGDISIFGLAEGKYMLVETKAPDGYILPDAPFMIEIKDEIDDYGTVGTLEVITEHSGNGSIVNTRGTAEGVLTVWAEITNKPGAMLPETGGMGTTLFTVVGIVMMAGALAFFSSRKRSSMA